MNVLFLCTGNSCRSQMAEGFARTFREHGHVAYSAGTSPQGVNPRTIVSMAECGIDIECQESTHVHDIPIAELDLVVSMCGHAQDHYPEELAGVKHVHWPLPDPADAEGDEDEIMRSFAEIRNDIRERVEELLNS